MCLQPAGTQTFRWSSSSEPLAFLWLLLCRLESLSSCVSSRSALGDQRAPRLLAAVEPSRSRLAAFSQETLTSDPNPSLSNRWSQSAAASRVMKAVHCTVCWHFCFRIYKDHLRVAIAKERGALLLRQRGPASFYLRPINAAAALIRVPLFRCRQHGVHPDQAGRLPAAGAARVPAAGVDSGQRESRPQQHQHTAGAGVRLRLGRRGPVVWRCRLHRHRPQHRRSAGYSKLHHHAAG